MRLNASRDNMSVIALQATEIGPFTENVTAHEGRTLSLLRRRRRCRYRRFTVGKFPRSSWQNDHSVSVHRRPDKAVC